MSGDSIISILRRLIDPDRGDLKPGAAELVLQFKFEEGDQKRIDELATKCTSGELTPQEATEYDNYLAAADLLAVWKAKARLSLQHHSSAA
jgi:hypothetical protein